MNCIVYNQSINVVYSLDVYFHDEFHCFFAILFRYYRFHVVYSQNLRRIKSWIVSKTFSEIVVRFYWTLKRFMSCKIYEWTIVWNQNVTYKWINKIFNKIFNCLLMINEVIYETRKNYLFFKKFNAYTFYWMNCTHRLSRAFKYRCVNRCYTSFVNTVKLFVSSYNRSDIDSKRVEIISWAYRLLFRLFLVSISLFQNFRMSNTFKWFIISLIRKFHDSCFVIKFRIEMRKRFHLFYFIFVLIINEHRMHVQKFAKKNVFLSYEMTQYFRIFYVLIIF